MCAALIVIGVFFFFSKIYFSSALPCVHTMCGNILLHVVIWEKGVGKHITTIINVNNNNRLVKLYAINSYGVQGHNKIILLLTHTHARLGWRGCAMTLTWSVSMDSSVRIRSGAPSIDRRARARE